MLRLLTSIFVISMMNTAVIFDFQKDSDINNWNVVDDVVMGGRSYGEFVLSPKGHGVFQGSVSLENNGGFSSIRYRFSQSEISTYSKFIIRLKGDGKKYQFRVKDSSRNYYSFITYITTSNDWQTYEIPFDQMYPSFRGRRLNRSNFSGEVVEEIGFLIGNKKAEDFKLEIDKIEMQ